MSRKTDKYKAKKNKILIFLDDFSLKFERFLYFLNL